MIRFIVLVGRLIPILFYLTFYKLLFSKRKHVSKIQDPLLQVSAVDVAAKIRNREVTSKQVVQAYIDRIREVNPIINAVVDERFDKALLEAEAADALIAKTEKTEEFAISQPFLGVPFTTKENTGVAGLKQTVGVVARKDFICAHDGSVITLLKRAGAIPLCVTNTPEFSLNLETSNKITGCTLNPYDTKRTPGGSSGGESALISCGASLFGIGSDIAGSSRHPALNTGIFGFKPTPGLIPYENYFPVIEDPNLDKYFSVGLLARYAKDVKPVAKIMMGENVDKLTLDKEVDFKKLKVYFAEEFDHCFMTNDVEPEIKQGVRDVTSALQSLGAVAFKLEDHLKNVERLLEIGSSVITGYADPKILTYDGKSRNFLLEYIKASFGCSDYSIGVLHFDFVRYLRGFNLWYKVPKWLEMAEEMEKDINKLLDENSVIVCPTFGYPALYHGEIGHRADGTCFLLVANIFGLPAIHVPLGLHKKLRIPIGVQVIAGPTRDHLCLQVAEQMEMKFGGWVPPE